MRMTDETPRVNHSFDAQVAIFSADKTARRLGDRLSEELVSVAGSNGGGFPPTRRTMRIGPDRPQNRVRAPPGPT